MIVWVAIESVEVVNVALPALSSVPGPSMVEPSMNVTEPPGIPVPGDVAVTFAVNVTDWPKTDGLTEVVTVVVVLAGLTTWVKVLDGLPL